MRRGVSTLVELTRRSERGRLIQHNRLGIAQGGTEIREKERERERVTSLALLHAPMHTLLAIPYNAGVLWRGFTTIQNSPEVSIPDFKESGVACACFVQGKGWKPVLGTRIRSKYNIEKHAGKVRCR